MIPNRHSEMAPYDGTVWMPLDGDVFRRSMAGADWSGPLGPGDPRLTPAGDHARDGTIPDYVPFAVINPGRFTSVPQ